MIIADNFAELAKRKFYLKTGGCGGAEPLNYLTAKIS
jgi:hypothetical protein